MWAELQAAPSAFTVAPAGRQRKPVLAGHPAEWVWSLTPEQGRGRQDLTVHIGAIIKQGDAQAELEVETTESLAIAIMVQPAPAAPAPAGSRPLVAGTAVRDTGGIPPGDLARRNDNIASISIVILFSVGCVAFLLLVWRRQQGAVGR